jgi:hypothetical protein
MSLFFGDMAPRKEQFLSMPVELGGKNKAPPPESGASRNDAV